MSDNPLESLLQHVKLTIQVARKPAELQPDGSHSGGGWTTAVILADGEHILTKVKPWMVGALSAAIVQLSKVQQEFTVRLLAEMVEADVRLLDAVSRPPQPVPDPEKLH